MTIDRVKSMVRSCFQPRRLQRSRDCTVKVLEMLIPQNSNSIPFFPPLSLSLWDHKCHQESRLTTRHIQLPVHGMSRRLSTCFPTITPVNHIGHDSSLDIPLHRTSRRVFVIWLMLYSQCPMSNVLQRNTEASSERNN